MIKIMIKVYLFNVIRFIDFYTFIWSVEVTPYMQTIGMSRSFQSLLKSIPVTVERYQVGHRCANAITPFNLTTHFIL